MGAKAECLGTAAAAYMSRQCALGLKSVAKATGTPPSIMARAGGLLRRSRYAVVGSRIPNTPALA